MKLSEIKNNLKKGLSVNEIINADLNLIGNSDETDSLEDVKSNATTDNFVKTTRQRGGVDRTNALFSIDLQNTVIEEDLSDGGEFADYIDEKRRLYPIIFKNLDVLIDSCHRGDLDRETKALIVKLINDGI